MPIFNNLKNQNNQRKDIQKQITQEAIVQASDLNNTMICIKIKGFLSVVLILKIISRSTLGLRYYIRLDWNYFLG